MSANLLGSVHGAGVGGVEWTLWLRAPSPRRPGHCVRVSGRHRTLRDYFGETPVSTVRSPTMVSASVLLSFVIRTSHRGTSHVGWEGLGGTWVRWGTCVSPQESSRARRDGRVDRPVLVSTTPEQTRPVVRPWSPGTLRLSTGSSILGPCDTSGPPAVSSSCKPPVPCESHSFRLFSLVDALR